MRWGVALAALLACSSAHAQSQSRDPHVVMKAIHEGAPREGWMKPVYGVVGIVGASLLVTGPVSIWLTWQPRKVPDSIGQIESTVVDVELTAVGVGAVAVAAMSIFKRNPLHELEINYAHLLDNDALSMSTRYDVMEAALRRAAMQEKQSRINRGLVLIACSAAFLAAGLTGLAYAVDPVRTNGERNDGFVFSGLSFAGAGLTGVLTALMFAVPEPVEIVWRQFAPPK